MNIKIPELLAPAGSMESAIAAINAGADALYLGGKNFSARSSAQNFTEDELVGLIEYAALRKVRVYIAVNTLYKNHEMPHVLEFVRKMHSEGAAAFILQDPGLAYILKTNFPDIEIHASTQMSVHSTAGVSFMKQMGFSRVVLSRELSLQEVEEINRDTDVECEVFVHGALCISYSGQCLMSSLIGGRSGNRGKCAQICRTRYALGNTTGYLLSPKDMMTLEILQNITTTGVSSLKIEGRMKSPEYVFLVTQAYRRQLNKIAAGLNTPPSQETLHDLLQIFNRGGSFTTGYYNSYAGLDMLSTVTPKSTGVLAGEVVASKGGKCKIKFTKKMNPGDGIEIWINTGEHVGTGISKQIPENGIAEFVLKGENGNKVYKSYDKELVDTTKKAMSGEQKKHIVTGEVEAIAGDSLRIKLSTADIAMEKTGETVETAKNAPMPPGEVLSQLSKTGNTPFKIDFTSVRIGENIYVNKGALNQLRRSAIEELEATIVKKIKKITPSSCEHPSLERNYTNSTQTLPTHDIYSGNQNISVQINDVNYLPAVLSQNISRVYINYTAKNIANLPPKANAEIFIAMPTISRNTTETELELAIKQLESTSISGYLVSTYGQLHLLRSTKKQIMLNYTFNIFNSYAAEFFTNMGVDVTLSQELNTSEIKSITSGYELIVYGQQILMTTHNCPIGLYVANKNGRRCNQKGNKKGYTLADKMGVHFPILTDCHNCIAHILNGKLLDTAAKFQPIKNTGAKFFRLIFTSEDEKTISETIARYKQAINNNENTPKQAADFTYGHFFRGVD